MEQNERACQFHLFIYFHFSKTEGFLALMPQNEEQIMCILCTIRAFYSVCIAVENDGFGHVVNQYIKIIYIYTPLSPLYIPLSIYKNALQAKPVIFLYYLYTATVFINILN